VRSVTTTARLGLVALLLSGAPSLASAQELGAPTSTRDARAPAWELAGKAGFVAPPVRGGTSAFGGGFGGRLGVSIAGVYLGASVVDYLGQTDIDVWSHALLYGGELGADLRLASFGGASLVLRPQLGAGGLTIFRTTPNAASAATAGSAVRTRANVDVVTTASGGAAISSSGSTGTLSASGTSAAASTTTTVSNLYVQPGATLLLTSPTTFVGVNASMLVVPSLSYGGNEPTTWVTFGLEGQLGVRF
jgi:hypothetical protein